MSGSLTDHWRIGRSADRPVQIFANLSYGSYGDFVSSLFFVNCVADRFDHKIVTVMYRNDRDFRSVLTPMIPGVQVIEVPAGSLYPPIDLVDSADVLRDPAVATWFQHGRNFQHIFITNAMAAPGMLWTFDRHCYLKVPEAAVTECTEGLVRRGLDPARWFVALHAREPGYLDKPNSVNLRDCDPNVFWHATNHIIRNLGGQVVRLGHPSMTPFPALPGLVDLSRDAGPMLQTFAISRSRFFLGGPSGPAAVADAFNVPHAQADAVDYYPHNEGMVIRSIDLITPDGRVLRQKDLFDAGYSKLNILGHILKNEGYRYEKNSAKEVIRLANFVYERTADTIGWRAPAAADPRPRPNQFSWPPGEPRPKGGFLPMDGIV